MPRTVSQPSRRAQLNTDPSTSVGFKWRMEAQLAKAIEEQYLSTNIVLKSLLFNQSQLLWHLKGMGDFYFMMQGEVMHSFSTIIFRKMLQRRPWYDSYVLGSTFNRAAVTCNWKHSKYVKVQISCRHEEMSGNTGLSGLQIQVLDRINFEYLLPWPLAGVVCSLESVKQMYSRITCLLLQVKTAMHAVELSLFLKSRLEPSPDLRLFWKLRMRFLSTVNDLWSYFMTTVLDVQFKKFLSEIQEQCDLDDMIELSHKFINVCYERCFLKERTAPLHRSLMTMLNLAIRFSALFGMFIRQQKSQSHDPSRSWSGIGLGSDSESELLDNEQDDDHGHTGGSEKRKKSVRSALPKDAGITDGMDDEDVSQDAEWSRTKRSKTGPGISGFSQADLQGRPDNRRLEYERNWGRRSCKEQLLGIEQEFNRCRQFLATSLRVIVNSNAARGSVMQGEGGTALEPSDGEVAEGDSNYLDGLILALS
ncbi:Gamma-tubulin complex component 5 [Mortierella sp. GBA43]|nr:Gamma-tubulin complex component 5 [Mortierella sp. GBA43]